MEKVPKKGIVLMNLGSPDSPEVKDVRKYLNEFLMDKRVMDMPYIFRLFLVKGIIVPFRAPKSASAYRSIWTKEGSPLIAITRKLQFALQVEMEQPVSIAMRYGNPCPKASFDELLEKAPGLEEVVVLPLYPHYAMASFETAVEYIQEIHRKHNYHFKLTFIKPYYNDQDYLKALSDSIQPYLQSDYDHILFSFHGLPERHIYKADITKQHCLKTSNCCEVGSTVQKYCYRYQCLMTMKLVTAQLEIPVEKYSFSFQSRLGRDEWLKPDTAVRLQQMPEEGIKKLLVVCPAFVSDCLETLEEIAIEGREIFLHSGGETFTQIPCLNVHPSWIRAIKNIVKRQSD